MRHINRSRIVELGSPEISIVIDQHALSSAESLLAIYGGEPEHIPRPELMSFAAAVPGISDLATHIRAEVAGSGIAVVHNLPFFDEELISAGVQTQKVRSLLMLALASLLGFVAENDVVSRRRVWDVTPNADLPENITTTSNPAPLHTDLSWDADPPGLILLYVEKQVSRGGRSTFIHLDDVLQHLRNDRLLEKLLRTVALPFIAPAGYAHNREAVFAPVLARHGIRWRYDVICDGLSAYPVAEADRTNMVEAFNKVLTHLPVRTIDIARGSLIAVSNLQALHGREGFQTTDGTRLLHRIRVRAAAPP